MPAAYDYYDYPSYWKTRVYEHESETIAVQKLLAKVKKIDLLVDLGSGFGRLTSLYLNKAKKAILVDPSAHLLKIARKNIKHRNIKFIQSSIENLGSKVKKNTADVVLVVRVIHHLPNVDTAFWLASRLCKTGGYLILEYPNKRHVKAMISETLSGDITYSFDILPKDRRSSLSVKNEVLPFFNFHPNFIKSKLETNHFKLIQSIPVSHFRSPLLKRLVSLKNLLRMETFMQKYFTWLDLTPSIIVLAQKV